MENPIVNAKKIIQDADVLIYTIGAGMGVQSGIGTFRGRNQVDYGWGPFERNEETPYSMSKPRRFNENPHLAWGYTYTRGQSFTNAIPHEGYRILLQWVAERPYAVFTSNIDNHFHRAISMFAGTFPEALVEYHGSVAHMQCHVNCKKRLYDPLIGVTYTVDPISGEADSYPTCPDCGSYFRNNVCLIGDGAFNGEIRLRELARLKQFEDRIAGLRVVVIEIGAGHGIPTVRNKSEELVSKLGATLIRINLDDPEGADICIGEMDALEALLLLE